MTMTVMTTICFYTIHSRGCEMVGILPVHPPWAQVGSHTVCLSSGLGGALVMMEHR